jgi:hypothetical protein
MQNKTKSSFKKLDDLSNLLKLQNKNDGVKDCTKSLSEFFKNKKQNKSNSSKKPKQL